MVLWQSLDVSYYKCLWMPKQMRLEIAEAQEPKTEYYFMYDIYTF